MTPVAFPLPDPPLTDGTIVLRAPTPGDVDDVYAACRDPDIQRFTFVPVPYHREHAVTWIADAPARRAQGIALSFVIAAAGDPDGRLLGTTSLLRPDWEHLTIEVGYFVAPWARGRGVAARGARLLAHHAITALGFARVACDVDVENTASLRVAEAAGFVREGVARSAIEAKGRRWSLAIHSLIPEDLAS